MARLWLHIGHGKTGTTAIQVALRHRAATRGDLFYPARGQTPAGAHHLLFPLMRTPWDAAVTDGLRQLSDDLDGLAAGRPVVLSSEQICYLKPGHIADIARIFAAHDVTVVYYLRRQDELIETTFRQKQIEAPGRFPDPAALVEDTARGLDFERILAPWEAEFGTGRLHVRLYHARTCAADVVADFETAVGLARDGAAPARANLSLSPTMVRVLQVFDRHYPDAPGRAEFVNALRAVATEDSGAWGGAMVPADQRRAVMARHAEANARVAARHLAPAEAALFLAP